MSKQVLLDAGHYGKRNRSPVVPEYYESEWAWKYHLMVRDELIARGVKADTTRPDKDEDLAVTERGAMGEGYDLMISYHTDAADEDRDRVYAIHQVQTGEEHEKTSLAFAEYVAPILHAAMECTGKVKVATRYSDYDRDKDGYDDDYYGLLRGASFAKCAAVILEHSYHTNERATRWLMDDDNLKLLASIEADAIAEFLGVEMEYEVGDVNGDGKVDQFDYILAKRVVLGTYKPTEEELKRCDVNGDGKVDVYDYIAIKRIVMGTLKPTK